jgi:hypothetical protein
MPKVLRKELFDFIIGFAAKKPIRREILSFEFLFLFFGFFYSGKREGMSKLHSRCPAT